MTFTDEDLKRLKEYANNELLLESEFQEIHLLLPALIARLEAAEKCANELPDYIEGAHDEYCHNETPRPCPHEEDRSLIEAWRKVAGK